MQILFRLCLKFCFFLFKEMCLMILLCVGLYYISVAYVFHFYFGKQVILLVEADAFPVGAFISTNYSSGYG